MKKYAWQYIKSINKNTFRNFLIMTPHHTRTQLFQKLLSPAPAPEMHSCFIVENRKGKNRIPPRLIAIICQSYKDFVI